MANLIKFRENLEKLGYKVSLCATKEEASDYLSTTIVKTTVGIGGSMTVKELDLYPRLQEQNEVIWAWEGGDTKEATRCSVYISSVNGASESGELINIDGLGNRVSATIYGTEKVFFIIGVNKIEENYDKALWRARNIASPKNAQRLQKKTPCAVLADKCYDCNSPDRICRSMVVHLCPPSGSVTEVVIIDDNLGY